VFHSGAFEGLTLINFFSPDMIAFAQARATITLVSNWVTDGRSSETPLGRTSYE
jgi:hypothetical protein